MGEYIIDSIDVKFRKDTCKLSINVYDILIHIDNDKTKKYHYHDLIWVEKLDNNGFLLTLLPRKKKINSSFKKLELKERYLKTLSFELCNQDVDPCIYVDQINYFLSKERFQRRSPITQEIFDFLNSDGKNTCFDDFHHQRDCKFRVIINPHGGKGNAFGDFLGIVAPFLTKCGISYQIETTDHSGHAFEMGYNHNCTIFEGVILVGGDGLVNEFINGLILRPFGDVMLYLTPFCILPMGSQNGIAESIGTPSCYTALYSAIKRSYRPLDGIKIRCGDGSTMYSLSGISFGIASDMVLDYEQTRNLKSLRYPYLKVKYGLFKKRLHNAIVHYYSDTIPELTKCERKHPHCNTCGLSSIRDPPKLGPKELDQLDIKEILHKKVEIEGQMSYWQTQRNRGQPSEIPLSTLNIESLKNELNEGEWTTVEEEFLNIGIVNANSEGEFSHASDGYMDLMLNKNGSSLETFDQLLKYVSGNLMKSSLFTYKKVKRVILETQGDPVANCDGEILPLTSVICFDQIQSFFTVFGEQ